MVAVALCATRDDEPAARYDRPGLHPGAGQLVVGDLPVGQLDRNAASRSACTLLGCSKAIFFPIINGTFDNAGVPAASASTTAQLQMQAQS